MSLADDKRALRDYILGQPDGAEISQAVDRLCQHLHETRPFVAFHLSIDVSDEMLHSFRLGCLLYGQPGVSVERISPRQLHIFHDTNQAEDLVAALEWFANRGWDGAR